MGNSAKEKEASFIVLEMFFSKILKSVLNQQFIGILSEWEELVL